MIRYFYGEDTFAAREAVTRLAKEENARVIFWEAEGFDEESLAERLERGGGLFGKELAVLCEPSQLRQGLQEKLVEATEKKVTADLILWDSEPNERLPVFKYFQKKAQVFSALSARQLEEWLTAQAKERQAVLEPGAAARLVARIGPDRWRLLSELEKLSLQNERITSEHVAREVPDQTGEGEIFELLRLVTAGKKSAAIQQLEGLLTAGNSEFYILSMLAYQFRKLYLAQRTGIWLNGLARVVATDFSIKQGKVDARTGVTMLILGLTSPTPVL